MPLRNTTGFKGCAERETAARLFPTPRSCDAMNGSLRARVTPLSPRDPKKGKIRYILPTKVQARLPRNGPSLPSSWQIFFLFRSFMRSSTKEREREAPMIGDRSRNVSETRDIFCNTRICVRIDNELIDDASEIREKNGARK